MKLRWMTAVLVAALPTLALLNALAPADAACVPAAQAGPVTMQAQCAAEGVGTWAPLPLGTYWRNAGGDLQIAQYRAVGDVVCLRGILHFTGGWTADRGAHIGTLPEGFRPLATEIFVIPPMGYEHLANAMCIAADGRIVLDTFLRGQRLSLSGTCFSTSA